MKTLRTLTSFVLTGFLLSSCYSGKNWRTASRQSAGMAPDPSVTMEAVMQVYGADTWGWRGWFAIHTWIAAKRTGESNYKVYDVVGWRGYSGHPVMRITQDIPDRYWFGEKPRLIKEHRGGGTLEYSKDCRNRIESNNLVCSFCRTSWNGNFFIIWT